MSPHGTMAILENHESLATRRFRLCPVSEPALRALLASQPDRAVAVALGVPRSTVSGWRAVLQVRPCLKPGMARVLACIRAHPGRCLQHYGVMLGISRQAVCQVVNTLERRGLVQTRRRQHRGAVTTTRHCWAVEGGAGHG
jgi:hypothetical protein